MYHDKVEDNHPLTPHRSPMARLLPLMILVFGSCDGGTLDGSDAGSGPDAAAFSYSIAVLPDTQYYASSWPDIFDEQTAFLVSNRSSLHLAMVLHTGDVVDTDTADQWDVARWAMNTLDGQVPYVLTAGNHDYAAFADRTGMVNSFFSTPDPSRFPWIIDTFEEHHIENSASLIDVPGGTWLVLALEFGPRDEVLDWANRVLLGHPTTPAIVITHAYLYRDGSRYDRVRAPNQEFNPHDYLMAGSPGTTVNDGAEIWSKVVEPNHNVVLVLSGHDVSGNGIPPGTVARLDSVRSDGTTVHQVMANYQTCLAPPCSDVHGGDGFLRIVKVLPDGQMHVQTYSPHLDRWLADPDNDFTLGVSTLPP